jgi:hypothetical protein
MVGHLDIEALGRWLPFMAALTVSLFRQRLFFS